jgi:hypothetical protein
LTTSTTGNFYFLSPLTLAGTNNTGAGVERDSNATHKTLPRQDVLTVSPASILETNQGNISETLAGLSAVGKEEQANSSGSSDNFTSPSLRDQLFEITTANAVRPVVSNTPGQSYSIGIAGVEKAQLVHVINLNVGSTAVPVLVGTSGNSLLTGNVANGHSLVPATLPVQVAHQAMIPNVLYQSQVYSA